MGLGLGWGLGLGLGVRVRVRVRLLQTVSEAVDDSLHLDDLEHLV